MSMIFGPEDLEHDPEVAAFALSFTRLLCARDFEGAARAVAGDPWDEASLRAGFERMIPDDWGSTEPLQVMWTMSAWPSMLPGDEAVAYVAIPGEGYSEAVTLIVTRTDGRLLVREIEFGRP